METKIRVYLKDILVDSFNHNCKCPGACKKKIWQHMTSKGLPPGNYVVRCTERVTKEELDIFNYPFNVTV